jgi:hypothetical protein
MYVCVGVASRTETGYLTSARRLPRCSSTAGRVSTSFLLRNHCDYRTLPIGASGQAEYVTLCCERRHCPGWLSPGGCCAVGGFEHADMKHTLRCVVEASVVREHVFDGLGENRRELGALGIWDTFPDGLRGSGLCYPIASTVREFHW